MKREFGRRFSVDMPQERRPFLCYKEASLQANAGIFQEDTMKVLVTGFMPFGGESINPAYEAVKLLPDMIGGAEIVKKEIPVVFDEGAGVVKEEICKESPDIVICVGQAGGRTGVTPEKVGINLQDARIPDNGGNQPLDKAIEEDGPAAYFTLLPVKAMVENMKQEGIPASVSYSAGTYVCNDVMYHLLYDIDHSFKNVIGGFIHVPFCLEQVQDKPGVAALSIDTIARGLEICIRTVVLDKNEKLVIGGEIQ